MEALNQQLIASVAEDLLTVVSDWRTRLDDLARDFKERHLGLERKLFADFHDHIDQVRLELEANADKIAGLSADLERKLERQMQACQGADRGPGSRRPAVVSGDPGHAGAEHPAAAQGTQGSRTVSGDQAAETGPGPRGTALGAGATGGRADEPRHWHNWRMSQSARTRRLHGWRAG